MSKTIQILKGKKLFNLGKTRYSTMNNALDFIDE